MQLSDYSSPHADIYGTVHARGNWKPDARAHGDTYSYPCAVHANTHVSRHPYIYASANPNPGSHTYSASNADAHACPYTYSISNP